MESLKHESRICFCLAKSGFAMGTVIAATTRNGLDISKNMTWKIEAILSTAVSFTPLQRLSAYLAQEVLVVLVVTAAMLVVTLLFAIAFVLFSSGVHFGFLWLRTKAMRIAVLIHEKFAHREVVVNLPPRRN